MMAMANDLLSIAAVSGLVCTSLVFVAAGAQKLRHRAILSGVIANYRLLPGPLVSPAAMLLPPVEILLGAMLLGGVARPFTSLAAMALLGLFAAAMAINIRRGRSHIDCGCNQAFLHQPLRWTLVARNLVLTAALLPSLAVTTPVSTATLTAGVAAGAAFFMLYLLVNAFAALPRPGQVIGAHA